MKILDFFFFWVIFALLDPDPDPATQINADPDTDPDPKPCFKCSSVSIIMQILIQIKAGFRIQIRMDLQ
jgi:hypothetical protein